MAESINGVSADIKLHHGEGTTEFSARVTDWKVCSKPGGGYLIHAVLEPCSGVFTTPPRGDDNYAEAISVPKAGHVPPLMLTVDAARFASNWTKCRDAVASSIVFPNPDDIAVPTPDGISNICPEHTSPAKEWERVDMNGGIKVTYRCGCVLRQTIGVPFSIRERQSGGIDLAAEGTVDHTPEIPECSWRDKPPML